ncbi:MAG: site-2 protease family protein [Bryobacteraceae bacterium]
METDVPVEVFLVEERYRQRYWLHALLLLATLGTTLIVGAGLERNFQLGEPLFSLTGSDTLPFFPIAWILQQPVRLLLGIPFSLSLMTILLAHEMGHYYYCVRYRVHATLPFFIPAPTLIGTMGAFIRIRAPIRTRTALFDIGIAGPIAGFIVALLVLLFAFTMSKPAPPSAGPAEITFGYPLIFRIAHWFVIGDGAGIMPLNRMLLHPTAIAAWAGMFATALNLLPGGQLDGGHIVYALAPGLHRSVSRIAVGILLPMGIFFWIGWLVWALLLTLSGIRHPNVPHWPALTRGRSWLALVALVMLALTLIPAPFTGNSLLEIIRSPR